MDLLLRFVENVFRKVSKRARKAVRSVLPVSISTKLVSLRLFDYTDDPFEYLIKSKILEWPTLVCRFKISDQDVCLPNFASADGFGSILGGILSEWSTHSCIFVDLEGLPRGNILLESIELLSYKERFFAVVKRMLSLKAVMRIVLWPYN